MSALRHLESRCRDVRNKRMKLKKLEEASGVTGYAEDALRDAEYDLRMQLEPDGTPLEQYLLDIITLAEARGRAAAIKAVRALG